MLAKLRSIHRDYIIRSHLRRLLKGNSIPDTHYRDYLKLQLDQSFSKRQKRLPVRAKTLIDKAATLLEINQCDILCVGCRNNDEIDYFRSKGAKSVIGIDLFSNSRNILVMDMHDMRFEDNSFDIIYSSHSLEHAFNVKKAVNEFIRVARDGGTIIIEVPTRYKKGGSDLFDFETPENLLGFFKPHLDKVIWSEDRNNKTNNIKSIIRIHKKDGHR